MPLTTFIKSFGAHRSVDIYVKAGSEAVMARVQDEVRAILRGIRHTACDDPGPFGYVTAEAMQGLWSSISVGAFSLMIFISSISLVVAAS